jgi:hypothetical protein
MDCNDLTEDTDLLSDSLVTNDQKEDGMWMLKLEIPCFKFWD